MPTSVPGWSRKSSGTAVRLKDWFRPWSKNVCGKRSNQNLTRSDCMELSQRIGRISVSSTLAVVQKAAKLKASGISVVDFGAGEPDFPTPDNIKRAAIEALNQNFTK